MAIVKEDGTGKCPHCYRDVYFWRKNSKYEQKNTFFFETERGNIFLMAVACPACKETTLICSSPEFEGTIYPFGTSRPPLPPEVPDDEIKKGYLEACRVAHLSSNAAGALARRALSRILVKCYGAKEAADLPVQIEHAAGKIHNPSLVDDLDYVRQVGRFAAHAKENLRTNEIIDVTPQEVEATLTIVETLLDEHYVQPKRREERMSKLKEKVESAKKKKGEEAKDGANL